MEKFTKENLNQRKSKIAAEMRDLASDPSVAPDDVATRLTALETELKDIDTRLTALESSDSLDVETNASQGRKSTPLGSELRFGIHTGKTKGYSFVRAINAIEKDKCLNGYERELSDEVERRSGFKPKHGGFFVPSSREIYPDLSTRSTFDTTAGAGAIPTVLGTDFIEFLRANMICVQAGATTINATGGTFSLSQQTATASPGFVAAGAAPSAESNATIGKVTWTPQAAMVYTDIDRMFMAEVTNIDTEKFVREDLGLALGELYDQMGLNGSGSGQPTGILQNSSVPTVALGTNGLAPTYPNLIGMESSIENNNAPNKKRAYVTTPKAKGAYKQTPKVSNYPDYLWEKDNTMNGYPAFATANMPNNLSKGSGSNLSASIFGDFSELVFAQWGQIEVVVDPYSRSTYGDIRIVAYQIYDVQLRHATSFAKCLDIVAE